MSRKTKLICTLGPATETEETIGRLMDAGANVFRLNMSHAKHEWAAGLVKMVRKLASQRNAHIGVLFDLTGPSIRTGDLPEPFTLADGDTVEFRKTGTEPTVEKSTTVNYDGLMGDVAVGNTLVVDNGALLMRIDTVEADRILCTVKTPGTMGSRRHINLPGVRLNLPALTEKDRKDLALAVECEADFIAGSFVRDAAHVRELRDAMKAYASGKPEEGDQHRARLANPVAAKLATWHRLRSGFGSAADYRAFLDANPAWPERRLLTQRYEEALFIGGGNAPQIRAAFAKGGPDHGAGFAALASTYLAEGKTEREIARLRRRAGQHQIAEAGQPHQRFRSCAVNPGETRHFGKAAGDQRGAGVIPHAAAGDDATGDGQHVLDGAAQLGANHIVGGIDAELRAAERGG